MAVVRKFLFDNDFGEPEAPLAAAPARPVVVEPPPPPEPTFSEAELIATREAALAEGYAAGEAAARAETARTLAEALAQISAKLAIIDGAMAEAGENAARLGIQTGVAVARRIVPNILRRHPTIEIETLFRSCLNDLADEPRVVLRVADPLLDVLQPDMQRLASRAGFGGKVIVIGDEQLDLGDCRVEWADGGAERDSARIWQGIDETVHRHLTPPAPPSGDTGADDTQTRGNGDHHGR